MQKTAFFLIIIVFFIYAPFSKASPPDSLALISGKVDSIGKRFDSSLRKKDSVQKKTDSSVADLKAKDAALRAGVDSSFSKAFALAKLNPKALYHPFKEHKVISIIAFIFLAFFLYKSFSYLSNSALCRDESFYKDQAGNIQSKPYRERPFSYSRAQLFWWTVIIITCYTIFYALNGTLLPLNSTILILTGMGLGTFIIGKQIDQSQIQSNSNVSAATNSNGAKNVTDEKSLPTRHQDIHVSSGFLTDVLSDESGISIHRLQAVAFNVIYGIGFIGFFISQTRGGGYPFEEFEQWQLTLLGVSAAGYLGIKTSENSVQTKAARETAALNNPPGNPPADLGSTAGADVNSADAAKLRDVTKF